MPAETPTSTPTTTASAPALDVDDNGQLRALTDGLLILRRLFGLTGGPLVQGAVGPGCTRCDAASIQPYLAAIAPALDVDGNGSNAALTDGILVLRFLFGFRGATLSTGAVGASCTRCDAAAIAQYLETLD
jgi:hypothetical protein